MKKFIFLIAFLGTAASALAQYKTVTFDYEKSFFDEGQPLPSETFFIIQGEVPQDVDIVQAAIATTDDKPLYKGVWKRAESNRGNVFEIPVSYKLRSGGEYNVRINYFKRLNARGNRKFNRQLFGYLDAYIDQTVAVERTRIRLNDPVNRIVENLNGIVKRSTLYYDNKNDIDFPGFSDLVTKSLKNMRNQDLDDGKFRIFKRKDDSNRDVKIKYARQQIEDLKELVRSEVAAYLDTELLTVYNSKFVQNYATEKRPNALLLNAGYGGVYFSGDVNDLSYDSAPYAGISFPLGNEALNSKILSRTTISVGVFITDFENGENERLSGPIVSRPIYTSLGYPILEFLRINAGAAILQNTNTAPDGISLEQISVRPFIGLSLDLRVWLRIGRDKL